MANRLGALLIDISANTAGLKTGIAAAQGEIAGFRRSAETASNQMRSWNNIDFGRLRGGLTGIAVAATGVSGPVGQVASMLASLTIGGGLAAGVVAGVGAIALGLRLFTKDAREAKDAADKLVKSLRLAAETPQQKAFADFGTLNKRAAQLQREIAEAQRGSTVTTEAGDALHFVDFAKVKRLQEELAGIQQAALLVGKNLTDALGPKPAAVIKQFRALRGEIEGINKESLGLSVSLGHNLGALLDPSRMGASAEEQQAMTDAANRGGLSSAMTGIGGERGLSSFGEESAAAAKLWRENWVNAIESTQNTFSSFFESISQEGFKLVDVFKGIAGVLLNLLLPGAGGLLGLLGLGGGGSARGNLTQSMHTGGIAGVSGGPMRYVHPDVFLGARRYHGGGLAGDEVPAILQRGERVLPRGSSGGGQTFHMAQNISFNVAAMDGASVAAMLRSQKATIAGVVAEAASEAPRFAAHIVRSGTR